MFKSDFDQIIREHFNLSDKYTRRYIATLEDAGQEQLLAALSSALYDKIVTKVDDIDFGTIPLSRGDINKVDGFSGTEECLSIIRRLVVEYKQNPSIVDVVLTSIQNIKDRRSVFTKAYVLDIELPMIIYNTMVLAIERSTSLMIATCIEYIKDPTSSSPKAALDKVAYQKTMDDLLFKQLISFNNMCHNKSLDKTLDSVMKHPIKVKEEVEQLFGTEEPVDNDIPVSNSDPEDYPVEDSPFDSSSSVEPSINNEPIDDVETKMTNDTEIPAPSEFPEDVPDTNPEDSISNNDVDEEDINPDIELDIPADDQAQNIPPVVEPISSTDELITEYEDDKDDDETTNTLQYAQNTTEPVEEIAPLAIAGYAIGAAIAAPLAIKGISWFITNTIIPCLRCVVYLFYYTKMKFSDYLAIQADLLEANANELNYSTSSDLGDKEKDKIVKKQMKFVEKLRKWSNKFSIDNKEANNKANHDIKSDSDNKGTVQQNQYGDNAVLF